MITALKLGKAAGPSSLPINILKKLINNSGAKHKEKS
jgi:hypothetical protein